MKLHKLTIPFLRENTAQWRKRDNINNALREIHDLSDEARVCLLASQADDKVISAKMRKQAATALHELSEAINELKLCQQNITSRQG